jgi:hypothetical protein
MLVMARSMLTTRFINSASKKPAVEAITSFIHASSAAGRTEAGPD